MHAVHTYQILNHYTAREDLDPGFGVLDNSTNERPDWYEYWPIRKFLLNESLDEDAFYGFLSPKFKLKTNLSAADVVDFIKNSNAATDVVLFSPSIHNSAFYLNVFEHGDAEHPGLMRVAQDFFTRINHPQPLASLVSDSRNTVHSNYFIAKPRFWRAWLKITEQLFVIAEMPSDPLGIELRTPTQYRGRRDVQMKIFLMERVATWILAGDASFAARARDPFVARSRIYKLPLAIICDALKIAYSTQGRRQYLDVFLMLRHFAKFWTLQVRSSNALGVGGARPYLQTLRSYWDKKAG
ncbi:MAG TPA: hypothetical protein VK693_05285 [Steroidobacteraceae bacterium]|jgi:hypothetical protein|nr:hypothetical protein [Steroidobacteraceae bacterium]